MNSKSLLIAIAAFALTATGVQAYGGAVLSRAGLSEEQAAALEEARELKTAGKYVEARDILIEAGITEVELRSLHRAASLIHDAIKDAVANKDYEVFKKVTTDLPLADIITSKADFEQFCAAHELRRQGDFEASREIMDELGLLKDDSPRGLGHLYMGSFTREQQDALVVARQSNDRATIQAIFDEVGYTHYTHKHKRGKRE